MTVSKPAPLSEGAGQRQWTLFSSQTAAGIPWMILNKIALMGVYFAVSIVLVRGLGKEQYGVYSLCKSVADYLVPIATLGLHTAILRYIPELVQSRSQRGVRRLLLQTFVLQTVVLLFFGGLLYAATPILGRWFGVDFSWTLALTGLFAAAYVHRNTSNAALTAMGRVRAIAILSFFQGFLWLGLLWWILPSRPTVLWALGIPCLTLYLMFFANALLLRQEVRRVAQGPQLDGIGRRRTMKLALSVTASAMVGLLMQRYTEIFFLGIYYSPGVVGVYELGCTVPEMLITLLPAATHGLFTTSFSRVYVQDQKALGVLMSSAYRLLILIVLPMAIFGAFFLPQTMALVYGPAMREAGDLASFFCLIHFVQLISFPVSMALVAKERVYAMFPLQIMSVILNLALDFLLIPTYGVWGGITAVLLTFALTIPIRLYVASRIIGGVHFPLGFLLKFTLLLGALGAGLHQLAGDLSLLGVLGIGGVFTLMYLGAIRWLPLISPAELADLESIGGGKLNRFLRFISGETA